MLVCGQPAAQDRSLLSNNNRTLFARPDRVAELPPSQPFHARQT
jgi:hypothetical protein